MCPRRIPIGSLRGGMVRLAGSFLVTGRVSSAPCLPVKTQTHCARSIHPGPLHITLGNCRETNAHMLCHEQKLSKSILPEWIDTRAGSQRSSCTLRQGCLTRVTARSTSGLPAGVSADRHTPSGAPSLLRTEVR